MWELCSDTSLLSFCKFDSIVQQNVKEKITIALTGIYYLLNKYINRWAEEVRFSGLGFYLFLKIFFIFHDSFA